MADEREQFAFVGLVEKADFRDVNTSNGTKEKVDVFAVGTGPDSNVTRPRRISLWTADRNGVPYSWLEGLRTELAKAAGLERGPKIPLRFTGTKRAADQGGYYYDGNKIEPYDPTTHGTEPSNAPQTNGGGGSGSLGGSIVRSPEPTLVTVSDALRAVEIVWSNLPDVFEVPAEGGGTIQVSSLSEADERKYVVHHATNLLRRMRDAVAAVNREPIRTDGEVEQ